MSSLLHTSHGVSNLSPFIRRNEKRERRLGVGGRGVAHRLGEQSHSLIRFTALGLAISLLFAVGSVHAGTVRRPVQECPPGSCGGGVDPGGAGQLAPMFAGSAMPWERSLDVATYSSVNMLNGNLLTTIPITGWNGLGPDMNFAFYHNSADGVWRFSYSRTLVETVAGSERTLTTDDGRQIAFTKVAGQWIPPAGFHLQLQQAGSEWRITTKDQWQWVFVWLLKSVPNRYIRVCYRLLGRTTPTRAGTLSSVRQTSYLQSGR